MLRDYQLTCLENIASHRERGLLRQLVVLPTGTGKTHIFAHLHKYLNLPGKVLVLAHREELLEQARNKLIACNPLTTVEIEQADRRASRDADFVVASVPTLGRENSKRLEALSPAEFSAIILDEAHHSSAKTYANILNHFSVLNGNPHKVLLTGWTATPNRADNVGLEEVFEVIAYQKTLAEMIEAKWLVPIRGYRVRTDSDLSGVHTRQGDFVASELSKEVNTEHRNRLVVTSYLEKAKDRKAIAFAVDIQHVYDLNETFKSYQVASEALVGETPPENRQRIVAAFRRGDIQVLVNCNIATEGFDVPDASAVILARPTQSGLWYRQAVGRGTRLHPGKEDLVVIDLVDNSSHHRLIVLPSLFGLKPTFDLEGKDALKTARDIEQLQVKFPRKKFDRAESLGQVKAIYEAIDLMDMAEFAEEAVQYSPLAWFGAGEGKYHLPLPDRLIVKILEGALGRCAVWVADEAGNMVWTQESPNLASAFQMADRHVRETYPKSLAVTMRGARWRKDSPTPAQLGLLAKLKIDHDPNELTKGRASNLISAFFASREAVGKCH